MPALRPRSAYGANKARVAALAPGGHIVTACLAEACSLRASAVAIGLRVSVHRVARGRPEHRVTLCGPLAKSP